MDRTNGRTRNRAGWIHWGVRVAAALAFTSSIGSVVAGARPGYLRQPDIHGDRIVFTAEGDLWTVPVAGGEARRITSHAGTEAMPRFSPDGAWIAFAGDYDGNRDLFVMPVDGGEPKRLTYHPGDDEPLDWSADGKEILFRSRRDHPNFNWEVYSVPVAGGDPRKLPVGHIVTFSVDPQSGRCAFTRIGGGGTWKRYRGGSNDDIWVGDPVKGDYRAVTDFTGLDDFPMWHGGRIYFLCDQGGTANIWSMNPDGSDRKRLTDLGSWDARWPANDATGRIVFMLAGDIHLFDPSTGKEQAVPIDLPSEQSVTRTRYPNAERFVNGFALSPDGDRLAIEARGEIFSVPQKDGVTLPITRGSGAREKMAAFDAKGKRVVYSTDQSGEQQLVTADAWGRGEMKEVTKPAAGVYYFQPIFSPDGAWIAYADQTQTLYVVKADGGEPRKVDRSEQLEIVDYSWSPDGRWLAYAKAAKTEFRSIYIYDTKDGAIHPITGWTTNDYSPTWDPDGRYLYFLSDRTVNPRIGWVDFEQIVIEATRPYMVLLRPDVENPLAATKGLPPKEDEKKEDEKGKKDDKAKDEKKDEDEKPAPVEIVFEGIQDRVIELPVEPGNYWGLTATSSKVFFASVPTQGIADEDIFEEPKPIASLWMFDMEEKEAKPFAQGIMGYDIQPKAGKIVLMKGRGEFYIVDAGSPPGDDLSKSKVDLSGLVIELDPREEWRQIFLEGWRNMRDYYWDAKMHGVDWDAVRTQYETLLPRLAIRDDLRDLMAEVIGELSTSHTYIWGGDRGAPFPSMVATGLLGAEIVREGSAFKVARVLRGDPADRIRSPLHEPEAAVRDGEYILAVNHQSFRADEPFEASLQGLAGKPVVLTVNGKPDKNGSREIVVTPIGLMDEAMLRYADWVRRNREYVAEKTGGKIGYVHIPDMGGRGLKEFDTWFYPQLDKEGMVVDARWNGGGFVSQLIVARLARQAVWFDRARGGGTGTYPYRLLNGPFVCMTNQFAGSDGDIFPAAIQKLKLAPVIGKRSWGGVIGIRGIRPLQDGGALTHPEFAPLDPKHGWSIENYGVDPDIDIENMPQELARGFDAQLDRAIQEVLRLHRDNPPYKPQFPPAPDRSRGAYKKEG